MTDGAEVVMADVAPEARGRLDAILDSAFEGWYLWHSKRILREVPAVRAAYIEGEVVGLSMLKELGGGLGYVYYVAVKADHRGVGIGGKLLDDSLRHFAAVGDIKVFACAEEENVDSIVLFKSRGFEKTTFGEMTKEYGPIRALRLVNSMRAVPGEIIMVKRLVGFAA